MATWQDITYYPTNVMDGIKETAWVEGVDGDGIGESITFFARTEQIVNGIKILNGYCKDEDKYQRNNRPKQIKIIFDNGTSMTKTLPDVMDKYYDIKFQKAISTSEITIEIVSVYPGNVIADTCISEIGFY